MGGLIYPAEVQAANQERLGKTVYTAKEKGAAEQFEALRPFLDLLCGDGGPRFLLDIGCGLGLIDVHIANHCPAVTDIHLIDGDGSSPSISGFHPRMQAWSDVRMAAAIVRANVRPDIRVVPYLAATVSAGAYFILGTQFDLVISARSWGHHYPISTYSQIVRRFLRPGGFVITDIRNKSDGLDEMQRAGFECVGQIPDPSLKCKRWIFVAEG